MSHKKDPMLNAAQVLDVCFAGRTTANIALQINAIPTVVSMIVKYRILFNMVVTIVHFNSQKTHH